MKTKLFALCMLALLAAAFAGCAKQPVPAPGTPDEPEPETDIGLAEEEPASGDTLPADIDLPPETEEEEPAPMTDAMRYAPLLDSLYAQLTGDEEMTGLTGFAEAMMASEDTDVLTSVGYRFEDVNGDGVTELLIGEVVAPNLYVDSTQGNALYAMYTLVDGEPTLVLEGWARNRFTRMNERNMFFHEGSGGAMYGIYAVYTFEAGADALTCKDYWFTAPTDDEQTEIGYYHNTVGDILPDESELLDVTPDDFWAASAMLGGQTVRVAFIPFSQYGNDVIVGTADMFFDDMTHDDVYQTGEDGEPITAAAFISPRGVTDFTVYALTVTDVDEDGHLICDKEEIASFGDLNDEQPKVMYLRFTGDMPEYGVSYTDADGNAKEYAVTVSGRDGSLILSGY